MIVVIGEALVDLVIDPAGNVTAALGGAPFNTARACGRLGVDVGFVGAVASDRFGTMLAAQLVSDGVSIEHLVRPDLPTTLAAAELDSNGAATYRFYIDGTSAPALAVVPRDVELDVLFTGGLALVLEPMAEAVESFIAAVHGEHRGDPLVMVDVNCRPLIVPDRDRYVDRVDRVVAGAHVVKVSDEDLAYLYPGLDAFAAARLILGRGPRAVLLTAGGDGVRVVTASSATSVAVDPVDVVDTIGAGDSFGGGFLSWWILSGNRPIDAGDLECLVPAVRAANTVAGVVCTRRGADPPWRSELPTSWSP